ncbi:MAG: hypothetical protein ACKPEN_05810 [Planktothrix sp.]|uniref:hypothetical protein n=1 Tax=Planktothrix sp. TaxID=3088171 RepID=UPI0038D3C2A5
MPLQLFYHRLKLAVEVLEKAVDQGKISTDGLATWDDLRVPPTAPNHLDWAKIKAIAMQVAPNRQEHFNFIQLPINPTMVKARVQPTQKVKRTSKLENFPANS